jgi:hypothetical protein
LAWDFYGKSTAPKALDIVWCRFPLVEDPKNPGPKARPGLVRRCIEKPQGVYVEVAYGTSKMTNYSECDLIIGNSTDLVEMGLPQVTTFQLARTVVVPWAKEWFTVLEARGPVIGRLNAAYREHLAYMQTRGYFKTKR